MRQPARAPGKKTGSLGVSRLDNPGGRVPGAPYGTLRRSPIAGFARNGVLRVMDNSRDAARMAMDPLNLPPRDAERETERELLRPADPVRPADGGPIDF